MLSFPPAVRIWLCVQPTDLRKSFDTLAELVRQHLPADPLSGHVFVFRNRRSDRVKLLYWDEDGYVIVYHYSANLHLCQLHKLANLGPSKTIGRCRHGSRPDSSFETEIDAVSQAV